MKTIKTLLNMKEQNEKISMITAYDYPSAKQVEEAKIDTILVGDSLGMVVLGYESTVEVTMEDMIHHARAVRRGAPDTFVIVDVPFGAIGIDESTDMKHAIELYRTTKANAIKIEGMHIELIKKCTNIGIPVVSHLGLTPQSVGITGYKLQASTKEEAEQLIQSAKAVESAGAVMLVLEAIPSDLAELITKQLTIPVIGIGAGVGTDGQVLVYHDLLNYGSEHIAKFVKQYGDFSTGVESLQTYNREVKNEAFPTKEHTYKKQVMGE